jgi:signal transduction histidine kinase
MIARGMRGTAAAAAAAALVTVLGRVYSHADVAFRSPLAHAAVETAAALIAASAAYLVLGRLRQRPRAGDLVLAGAFAVFAASNLLFQLVPSLARGEQGRFSAWAAVCASIVGAALLALAATMPDRPLVRPRHAVRLAAGGVAALLGGIAGAAALLAPQLPSIPRETQVAAALLFALASAGFTRRAARHNDELRRWLGPAAAVAAFARVNYVFAPALFTDRVYTGDVLRLAFYLLLLVGAGREVRGYWEALARAAVAEERRRVARELHDGLAQELAYIRSRAARGDPELGAAAARALDESRRAITVLTRPEVDPLHAAVAQTAEELALRLGFTVRLDVSDKPRLEPAAQEEVLRILREALTNAARHGRARVVTVTLENGRARRLRIEDDGVGFDPAAPGREGGFGLVSMRERASALGGELRVRSGPGAGTTVEVYLP